MANRPEPVATPPSVVSSPPVTPVVITRQCVVQRRSSSNILSDKRLRQTTAGSSQPFFFVITSSKSVHIALPASMVNCSVVSMCAPASRSLVEASPESGANPFWDEPISRQLELGSRLFTDGMTLQVYVIGCYKVPRTARMKVAGFILSVLLMHVLVQVQVRTCT
ncbi:hypothetical protein Bbelb_342750 [Branchiostoma belcheri]|nr:hypothetical protein Bbelb_342750 [Branchiostoma belcheri]